jgi:hypothetical protein
MDRSGLVIFIREVKVEIDAGPNRLPHCVPACIMPTLPALLAPGAPATEPAGSRMCVVARINVALGSTVVTEPVSVRHLLEINTICVPEFLTAITVHEHVFIVIFTTSLARLVVVVFIGDLKEHGRV